MTFKSSYFRCKRCNEICKRNKGIKKQQYCINCTLPRGPYKEHFRHVHKVWSAGAYAKKKLSNHL